MKTDSVAPAPSWRTLYPPHPCADVFPMMNEAELEALVDDIKANGLQTPVLLIEHGRKPDYFVLDGRNRLEALARLGVELNGEPTFVSSPVVRGLGHVFETVKDSVVNVNPAAFVISANIRRRHLTKEQQAELIVKTIAAGEEKNDRATVARSFSPTRGKKGGSTKDPMLAKAVTEAAKHGISKRTVQSARARLQGKNKPVRTRSSISKPKPLPVIEAEIRAMGGRVVERFRWMVSLTGPAPAFCGCDIFRRPCDTCHGRACGR